MMFREVRWTWVAVSLATLYLSPGLLAEEKKKSPVSKEEEVRAALVRPITMEFVETPLQDVLEFVQSYAGVDVVENTAALVEIGVDLDLPITLGVKDIPLEKGLSLVLTPLELVAVPANDVLLITSRQDALDRLTVKVYPVHDLVLFGRETSELSILGETLVNTVEKVVTPTSWHEEGGAGQVIFDPLTISLVVTQTYWNHREIESLLSQLREAKQELKGVAKQDGFPSLGQLEAAQVAAVRAPANEVVKKKAVTTSQAKPEQANNLRKAFSSMFAVEKK